MTFLSPCSYPGPVDSKLDRVAGSAGRSYAMLMRALPLLPRKLTRRQAARSAARIRDTVAGAAVTPDRPEGLPEA